LKITKITVQPITIEYKRGFTTAYGLERKTIHVLIQMFTDEGIVGLGEAAPLEDFTGENYLTIERLLKGDFQRTLVGMNPFDHALIHSKLNQTPGNPAAKSAVDIALWDIMGKTLNRPIHSLLGGKYRSRIETAEVIGIDEPAEMAEAAVDLKRQGFRTIKMKVGSRNVKLDAERVASVRGAIGSKVNLRVDANNSYSVEKAIQLGRKIKKHDLAYIEQPVAAANIKGLATVRRTVGIPITADESVHNAMDALKVVKHDAADFLAIKFAKCGGICEAKTITRIAELAGLKCVIISAFEVGVGLAADTQVAATSPSVELPCEIAIGPMYEDKFTTGILNHITYLDVSDKPGLGVELLNH
jgi:o-succinylbenzoate synthase